MRENTLRKIWARGEAVVNGWLSIPSSFSAEVMAHQGFDSLTVDMQDPPVVEAQQKIVEACKRHGVAAGIHNGTSAYALKMIAAGYQFVTLASESRFMAAKAAEEVAAVRKTGVKAGQLPAY